ncbi:MAG: RCC1 repeat-containing protein, partial [Polyangiaceae bacterium]|nr:RCC1 repeat-containing protein [Polyangiaceae bacterium]
DHGQVGSGYEPEPGGAGFWYWVRPYPETVLGSGVAAIDCGGEHTCAVGTSGALWCWGDNTYGQLGDTSVLTKRSPTIVPGFSQKAVAVSLGEHHSCVITTQGTVWCWGRNHLGQLGINSTQAIVGPTQVTELGSGVKTISSHGNHTCAITAAGGVMCWGYNATGQLGDNSKVNSLVPKAVTGLDSGVKAIACGGNHTCAITSTGHAMCWGHNALGQLGNDNLTDRLVPTHVSTSSVIAGISAATCSTCALTQSGSVMCWGCGWCGSLNVLTTVDGLESGVRSIFSGYEVSCALTFGGSALCWGDGYFGQLGNGLPDPVCEPEAVYGFP